MMDQLTHGRTWVESNVNLYEGRQYMAGFHAHNYFEVSLILSGYVKAFIGDQVLDGDSCRLMLAGPGVPHCLGQQGKGFYRRLNLLFSCEYLVDYVPEWKQLESIFCPGGTLISITQEQCDLFCQRIRQIDAEKNTFRKRLMILSLLSLFKEVIEQSTSAAVEMPRFVTEAMLYVSDHHAEKILASDLAWRLGVSRTTLMTAFKKYTGNTLGEAILNCRIKQACGFLRSGYTEQETAEMCGFGDAGSMIRAFKKEYGMTPRQFILTEK